MRESEEERTSKRFRLRSFRSRRRSSAPLDRMPLFPDDIEASRELKGLPRDFYTMSTGGTVLTESENDESCTSELSNDIDSFTEEEALIIQDPVHNFLQSAESLLRSDEMVAFAASSRDLAMVATRAAMRVAFLPVTMPLNAVTCTTSFVFNTCAHVTTSACDIVGHTLGIQSNVGEDTASYHPLEALVHNVKHIVPFVFRAAGHIRDDIVLALVAPAIGGSDDDKDKSSHSIRYLSCAGQSSAEQESFLDRLRLDCPEEMEPIREDEAPKADSSVTESKFLLRVGDLGLSAEDESSKTRPALYFDLCPEHSEEQLTVQALDALAANGLALLSNFDECPIRNSGLVTMAPAVHWKPEGSTEKILRKKDRMTPSEWTSRLEREVLVWSGKFAGGNHHNDKHFPLFMARGVVCRSPRDFLRLMWDNERCGEYNKWNLGRSDLLVIQDGNVLCGDDIPVSRGTKIVKSKTKIPFTGLSVKLSTLMHARPLDQDEEGYVILSRSLNTGRAGCHTETNVRVDDSSDNEILWGVNVLQSVRGEPNMTDLFSVSQVKQSMVPGFLSKKIGMMGVEDFFNAVRSIESY